MSRLRWRRGWPVAGAKRGTSGDRRIWQYGDWLAAEAQRHGFPVLDPIPFETLDARAVYALCLG